MVSAASDTLTIHIYLDARSMGGKSITERQHNINLHKFYQMNFSGWSHITLEPVWPLLDSLIRGLLQSNTAILLLGCVPVVACSHLR